MAYDKAGIRFSKDSYVLVDASGGGIERKRLYDNPDISQEQGSVNLFKEAEIEGYDYLAFTITNTSGTWEVEEWCEIAPLKSRSGQFIVSMPVEGVIYGRKIYRSNGIVKTSINVYKLGATTEDRTTCIVKSVDAVKVG